jgi:nucleotide-binding universal stress UspA family protein
MFEKILFATTASPTCDNAAHVAFDLAKKYDSKLYVFHVLGMPSRGFSPFVTDTRTGEQETVGPDYIEWVKEEMRNTYERQLSEYPNSEIETIAGIAHTEILRKARRENVDLIVMGAHSREEDKGATRYRSIVGSTMQKVSKGARCPVLIVSRPCTTCLWYFSNIIVGTDFSRASYYSFQFAANLAKEIGAKLWIFHAVDLSSVSSGKSESQTLIEQKLKEAKQRLEQAYASYLGDYDNYEVEVWEGIPYVEILKFAREKNGDLIVMAHHTREIDPEQALLGSTVEQVVLRSSCPVASVNRPDKVELHSQQQR